jgi:hypothetical protein
MTRFILSSIITSALLALCLTAPAQATGINRAWVSGKGTDAAGCGAPIDPCRSLQYVHDNIIAAGGEIDILDPAGYGAINITKALSIVNDGVGTAGVQEGTTGANAITFNGGTNDTLTLRGLNIDGLGTGQNGIVFNSGAGLTIVNCVVRHFAFNGSYQGTGNGILIAPTSGSMNFVISNAIASDNGTAGIAYLPPSGGANANGVIDHVLAINNEQFGINLNTYYVSGGVRAITISNSTASNNSYGIYISSQSSQNSVTATVDSSYMSNNQYGVLGENAVILLSRSVITSNSFFGALNDTSSTFYTYGDNRINKNGTDIGNAALTPYTPQ